MADWIRYISNKFPPTKSPQSVVTNTKSIYIESGEALSQFRDQYRERGLGMTRWEIGGLACKYSKHHPWQSLELSITGSKLEHFRWFMHVESMDITLPIRNKLVPVLDFPPRNLPTEEPEKWDGVEFYRCTYSLRNDVPQGLSSTLDAMLGGWAGGSRCACCLGFWYEDDVDDLSEMLVRRNKSLTLRESPEILSCLLKNRELESPRFFLDQSSLSASDCKRLGNLVKRSCNLKCLTLQLTNLAEPQMLAEPMGKAIHLQELTIEDGSDRPSMQQEQQRQTLADIFVRPGGNDIVGRLLQNSKSCLKMLCLHSMQLEDRHFMVIVDALSTSQLEDLDVSKNNIQCPAILQFAAQLCTNKTLTRVNLARNPWEDDWEETEKCWVALQQGLAENCNIQYLGARDVSPLKRLADYYCRLNRAGRQILRTSDTSPLGLWPFILQRAGKDKDNYLHSGDSVFQFLQSSHILPHLCSISSLKTNRGNASQILDVLKKAFKINPARAMISQNIIHS